MSNLFGSLYPEVDALVPQLRKMGPEALGLEKLSHSELTYLRKKIPKDLQNMVAPYEHQAYAREIVEDNPLAAIPMTAMIPGYQVQKMWGNGSRSDPSLDQVTQGYKGVGQGLWQAFQNVLETTGIRTSDTDKEKSATALISALQSYPPASSTANKLRPLPTKQLGTR